MTTQGAGYDGPYDLVLQDTRDNPTLTLGLTLHRGEEGDEAAWREERIPPLSERRSQGELSFTHRDPTYDLVFSQSDWSDGALQPYYSSDEPRRYAQADGMDLRWAGVASLGPRVSDPVSVSSSAEEWSGSVVVQGDTQDTLYAIAGRTVLQYNRTSERWETVLTHPSTSATSIVEYNGVVYVAFGNDTAYYYYTGEGAWTPANISASNADADDSRAMFWVKARNATGKWVLWKSLGTNQIQWNDDPIANTWQPDTPFVVGDSDRSITNMYSLRDTFVVGKTSGLWLWNPTVNDFSNVTNEWDNDISPENGRVGQVWHLDLFITAAQQGFFRYSLDELEDLSGVISQPRLPDVGGRVTAMAGTTRDLLLALEQSKADDDPTKRTHIARMRLSTDARRWQLHTLALLDMRSVQELVIDGGRTVWALGTLNTGALGAASWNEPTRDVAAFADVEAEVEREGWFETGVWHGGVPDAYKACLAMTIWGEGVDREHPVVLSIGRDGAPSDTDEVGVFDIPARVQTIRFDNMPDHLTRAVCRFGQFRFTLRSDDDTPPRIFAFELHAQAFFEPIRAWVVDVEVVGLLRTGVLHELTKREIESAYAALERQVFPITMRDALGSGRDGPGVEDAKLVRLVNFTRLPNTSAEGGQEIWRLTLQEALPPAP